ncbi:hypothetical protein BKE30_13800 [Alkanindiges hydrocarboniclasticus]|uniref:Uncharacterized protein n=1 Tax=Alkanindiges hydrocarboniclasticus TaxID=1907941 RepID=A0A1S8CQV5_9GAMM|nr:hypothetical protein [Alkanindiges hydrocarboniclasticus]ONG37744.1 hypothetical protein BKE30_13800 [Alkanindiges hydrocarboniclasticus]
MKLPEQYQLAQHLMGNRRRLRWIYPDYKRGMAECMALALEARLLPVDDTEAIQKAIIYHQKRYAEDQQLFKTKFNHPLSIADTLCKAKD